MKLLYVITKANWGGAQRYVWDLMEVAYKEGHEPALAYGEPGLLSERVQAAGLPCFPISGFTRDLSLGSEVEAFTSLLALIEEVRPDVVHVNSSKAGLALLAARFKGVRKILFTAHGWAFNEERPWFQRMLLHVVYAITVLLSHETICVSEAVRRDIGWVPGRKRTLIYNGIDAPAFKSRTSARESIRPELKDKVWMGMLAELHPTKRIKDAIAALAELKDEQPDLVLVVLGEGEERARLQEQILNAGLSERVILAGFVQDGSSYLPAFDFFLMPSRVEALAYALIEAGYAGLPVIASRAGGMPEVVKHAETGLLVQPRNPHVLARAIRRTLENPEEAKEFANKLQSSVTKRFSKERMVRETFARY